MAKKQEETKEESAEIQRKKDIYREFTGFRDPAGSEFAIYSKLHQVLEYLSVLIEEVKKLKVANPQPTTPTTPEQTKTEEIIY